MGENIERVLQGAWAGHGLWGLGTFWDLRVLGPRGDVTGMKELWFVPVCPPAFLGDTPKDCLLLAFPLCCLLFVRNMLTDEQKNKDVFLKQQEQGHCFKYISFLMSSRANIPLLICLCSGLIQREKKKERKHKPLGVVYSLDACVNKKFALK